MADGYGVLLETIFGTGCGVISGGIDVLFTSNHQRWKTLKHPLVLKTIFGLGDSVRRLITYLKNSDVSYSCTIWKKQV
ncbi:hypothetical protein HG15A2_29250 [Adhaeretor mobilis]|uniref:Uncharacterized protein n=1 Tax=Adhaeretor mobilis TaxID=1930276 RepID=A0A517MXL5_9BACT|nr:hypothetical protein HG15A2_29250 [Adhaeretor mobilis]